MNSRDEQATSCLAIARMGERGGIVVDRKGESVSHSPACKLQWAFGLRSPCRVVQATLNHQPQSEFLGSIRAGQVWAAKTPLSVNINHLSRSGAITPPAPFKIPYP